MLFKRKESKVNSQQSRFEKSDPALNSPYLNSKQKGKIRTKMVKEYIRSKPAGEPLSMKELILAAGYDKAEDSSSTGYTTGHGFITRLINRGIICKTDLEDSKKYSWSIPGDARTVVPPRVFEPVQAPEIEEESLDVVEFGKVPTADTEPENDDEFDITFEIEGKSSAFKTDVIKLHNATLSQIKSIINSLLDSK